VKCLSRTARRAAPIRAALLLGASIPVVVLSAPVASAQDYTNVIASGRVESDSGAPIANATVTITSSDRGVSRTVQTNEAGAYSFNQLTPGAYDFRIEAEGFEAYEEKRVQLTRVNGSANSFRLSAAGAETADSTAIVVSGRRIATSDFNDTTTGAVIDLAEIDKRVPIARTLRDVVLLAPGTVRGSSGSNSAFADQVSISGSSFNENAYFVNGLNITNFRMGLSPVEVPYDFYKTVEVKTGGFSAEFGRATGGAINAVTKSGTNEYHASVMGTWEPNGLRSTSPATRVINNADATSTRRELVLQASGPIIKDRLFIYGLYNFRDFKSFTPNADQDNATEVKNTSPFWGVKVDGYVTDGHHLEFTYFDSSNDTHTRSMDYSRANKTRGEIKGGTDQRAGGINYVGRYTGTFSPWLTFSAAYGRNKMRDGSLPLDITNERVIDYRTNPSGTDIGLNRVTDAWGQTDDDRKFYRADLDLNFQFLGGHHVRLGYDHETNTSTQIHQTMGDGFYKIYTIANDTPVASRYGLNVGDSYYTTRVYRNNGTTTVKNEAYYIQDDWSLLNDRLKLQLGLRNDRFSNQGADGRSYYKSDNLWAPRLGVSYDLFGDARTKVYGFFGKYYLPIPGDINLNIAGALVTYTRYNKFNGINASDGTPVAGDALVNQPGFAACPDTKIVNCVVSNDGSTADYSAAIAHNLKPQSVNEFILGGEHRLTDRIHLGLYFTHRSLQNAIEDISTGAGLRAYCVNAGYTQAQCSQAFGGAGTWPIANPGRDVVVQIPALPGGTPQVVTLRAEDLGYPKPKRNYNAVTFTFDRKYDGVWGLSGSYTWAMDKGNYEGGVRSENGQLAINRSADFDSPGFTNGAYGYLPNDRRHTLKLFGSYTPASFLDLGTNLLIQSPRHYSCIGTVPFAVDPVANGYHGYSYYCGGKVVQRGTAFKGDWLYQIDVSAVVKLPVPQGFEASLRLDAFNVFNMKSVTAYNEFGDRSDDTPNPLYRTPVAYQTPRYVRAQFRLGF